MPAYIKQILKNDWFVIILLGSIQGLFTAISLEPYNVALVGWLMVWALFYLAERFRNNVWKLLASGLICSLFFSIFTVYWMFHLFGNFGEMSIFASILAFLPFGLFFNLQYPAFILMFGLSMRSRFRKYFRPRWMTAGLFALVADYFIPQIFPYNWGNSIAGNRIIVQITDITGLYGLTFLLFAVSYFFYRMFFIITDHLVKCGFREGVKSLSRRMMSLYVMKRIFPMPILLIFCLIYGAIRIVHVENIQRSLPRVRVAIINPNAPPEDWNLVNAKVLKNLIHKEIPHLVEKAINTSDGKVDLVVLPESAVPFLCTDDNPLNRRGRIYSADFEQMVQLIAYNWNVDIFLNETTIKPDSTGKGKTYNSSVLYSRDGKRRDSYHKRELLAFGEYVPGLDLLKSTGLIRLAPGIENSSRFSEGPVSNVIPYSVRNRKRPYFNPKPLSFKELEGKTSAEFLKEFPGFRYFSADGYFIPLICYEVLFPDLVRSFFSSGREEESGLYCEYNPGRLVW